MFLLTTIESWHLVPSSLSRLPGGEIPLHAVWSPDGPIPPGFSYVSPWMVRLRGGPPPRGLPSTRCAVTGTPSVTAQHGESTAAVLF